MDSEITTVARGGYNSTEKTRDSNIELFRIITMVLIIAHHYVVNSGLTVADGPIYAEPFSWRSLFLLVFGAWGKIGINCFVLITGFFMCKSHITVKKFAKLLFEIYFYRIVISAIFLLTGNQQFEIITLVKLILPITIISTGFTQAYLAFFLLIPFLNILIQNMKERTHVLLLLWCGLIYVFLGTISFFTVTMNYVSWFCVLYLIASYIRLYPHKIFEKKKLWRRMTLILVAVDIASIIVCAWFGTKICRNMAYAFVTDSNTFLAVATGVSAFLFFRNWKIKSNRLINAIAATTFGVLLIHTFNDSMRQWLWKEVVDPVGHYSSSWMPFYAIGCVLAIFVLCSIIDHLRIRYIEKPFFRIWDANWDSISGKYQNIENKFFNNLGIKN